MRVHPELQKLLVIGEGSDGAHHAVEIVLATRVKLLALGEVFEPNAAEDNFTPGFGLTVGLFLPGDNGLLPRFELRLLLADFL